MSIREQYHLSGRLDVFVQLSIARKLAPALPIVDIQLKSENKDKPKNILVIMMLSQINDQDAQFIVNKCLSVVMRRQSDGTSAKLQTKDGLLLFDDLDINDILELTSWVIEDNLGDFFRTALTDSAD